MTTAIETVPGRDSASNRITNPSAVGDRGFRQCSSKTRLRERVARSHRGRLKTLAVLASGLLVAVAAVACFASSSNQPLPGRAYAISWIISAIDSAGDVGSFASLVLDSAGSAHISYRDATNLDLKYATNSGGSWANFTIESLGNVGHYTSIALDSSDYVHISYACSLDYPAWCFKYATNAGGSWVNTTIHNDISGAISTVALDSNDRVHISYRVSYSDSSYKGLWYATNAGGSWATACVEMGDKSGTTNSMALDSMDNAYIAYLGFGGVKLATNSAGSWLTSMIDNGGSPSLALDASDKVHVTYSQVGTGLKYATNADGSWANSTVDSDMCAYSSLALDASGRAHISYYDYTNRCLKYATNAGGSWSVSTIESVQIDMEGNSIALDSEGHIHIAYYDSTNQDLKYAVSAEPIPEFGGAGVVVVIIATVCIFVAIRRISSQSTKE